MHPLGIFESQVITCTEFYAFVAFFSLSRAKVKSGPDRYWEISTLPFRPGTRFAASWWKQKIASRAKILKAKELLSLHWIRCESATEMHVLSMMFSPTFILRLSNPTWSDGYGFCPMGSLKIFRCWSYSDLRAVVNHRTSCTQRHNITSSSFLY